MSASSGVTGQLLDDAAARGVGDPVRRRAVDRADRLRPDLERADVAARLLHVFLDVENAVVIAAERFLVLEDRLGGVAIVDLAQQPAPRSDGRLEHGRIAEPLDRLERALRRVGDERLRLRHARRRQRAGRHQLVAADVGAERGVHRLHALVVQDLQAVERAAVVDAALDDDVVVLVGMVVDVGDVEDQFLIVEQIERDAALLERLEQQLLFDADAAVEDADLSGVTHPSPLLPAAPAPA